MSILNHFPKTDKITEPREQQIEILEWIEKKLQEGKKKFIICAPTGSGKSPMSKSIGNFFEANGQKTLITSPLNTLVTQYKEFEEDKNGSPLFTLMGKSNYPCVARIEIANHIDANCEEGFCSANICSLDYVPGRKKVIYEQRNCKNCDKFECPCFRCEYKKAMNKFKNSSIGNTNFTLLQMGVTNEPDVLIIDESDYVEPFIRMFRTVTIPEYWSFDNFDDHLYCLEDYKKQLDYRLINMETSIESVKIKRILENQVSKITSLLNDYKKHQEKWIISHRNDRSTTYEPITINRFLDDALKTDDRIVFLISATPHVYPGWEYREVKSPFPKEIRPIQNIPIGSLSLKNRKKTIPILAEKLAWGTFDWLLPGKTIVHVPSYAVAEELGKEIISCSRGLRVPIVQSRFSSVENGIEGATLRSEVIDVFKKSKDKWQILIAVNMGRGIDLPELDIKNNVITYLKRQNHTDKLVKAKLHNLGGTWMWQECANELMQQYGRINRNNDKVTNTVITEPEFKQFNKLHGEYLREWFKEAIVE